MAVDTPKANGLKTVVDTIVSPKEAFESIRRAPTWVWALLIAIVVTAVALYLETPAMLHGYPGTFAQQVAADPRLQNATPEQQQLSLSIGEKFVSFVWLFVVIGLPFGALLAAVVMLIFDKIGHGEGSFGKYWAAACNIAIPSVAIGAVVSTLIVLARGTDTFATEQAVQQAVPSLALLLPGTTKLSAFLGTITPFTLWGLGLNVAAMRIIGRVGPVPAWLAGLVMLVVPGLFAMAGAK